MSGPFGTKPQINWHLYHELPWIVVETGECQVVFEPVEEAMLINDVADDEDEYEWAQSEAPTEEKYDN